MRSFTHTHNKLIFICRQGHLSAPLAAAQMHICNLSEINSEDYSEALASIHRKQMEKTTALKFLHFQNVSQVGGGNTTSFGSSLSTPLNIWTTELSCKLPELLLPLHANPPQVNLKLNFPSLSV